MECHASALHCQETRHVIVTLISNSTHPILMASRSNTISVVSDRDNDPLRNILWPIKYRSNI